MSAPYAKPSEENNRHTGNRPRKTTIADHYVPILQAIMGNDPVSYEAAVGHWLNDFKKACFVRDQNSGRSAIAPNPAFKEDPNFALLSDLCKKVSKTSSGPALDMLYGDLYYNEKLTPYIEDGAFSKFEDTGALKEAFKQTTSKLSLWIQNDDILDMLEQHLNILKPLSNVVVPFAPKPVAVAGVTAKEPCPFV